jgi:hypothetical protein
MFNSRRILLVLVGCATLSSGALANDCDAILRGGVFDVKVEASNTLALSILKKSVCSSDNSFGIQDFTATMKDVCDNTFEEQLTTDSRLSELHQASKTIANAWRDCVESSKGLIHYFQPTPDPTKFYYIITYAAIGKKNTATLRDWKMEPPKVADSCQTQPDKNTGLPKVTRIGKDTIVDAAGITLLCTRDRSQQIDVAVNADEGLFAGRVNPGLTFPADPVIWHFLLGTADDVAQCVLKGPSGEQELSFDANLQSPAPPTVTLLNDHMARGQNRLECQAADKIPDSNGKACWHYTMTVFKNGDVFWNPSKSCCGSDACGRAPAPGSQGVTILQEGVTIPMD